MYVYVGDYIIMFINIIIENQLDSQLYYTYTIQMHSEYLDENKICQFFEDQDGDAPRKQNEISLNLTITSKNTHSHPNNTSLSSLNNNNSHGMTIAFKELDKFNKWVDGFQSKNDKLVQDVTDLANNLQKQNTANVLLSMADLDIIRKKCNTSNKNIHSKPKQPLKCLQCKQKNQLLQIIQQQHQIKIDQCNQLKNKLNQISIELQKSIKYDIAQNLKINVEYTLIQQENTKLKQDIVNLKTQLDRNKLQKSSSSMQKSNSLLKTKVDLQKKLQSSGNSGYLPHANLTSNSNLKYSFSNMKNSTNPTNPNDTLNRLNSIINFQNSEPNLQQLIRYFEDEANFMKSKAKQILNEQKKIIKRKQNLQKKKSLTQYPQEKLYKCYSSICKYLCEIKGQKQRYGDRLSSSSHISLNRLNERSRSNSSINGNIGRLQTSTGNASNLETTSTTIISSTEYRDLRNTLKCLQRQINNLKDTKDDLLYQLKQAKEGYYQKINQCEQKTKQLRKYEQQYKILNQKYHRESKDRKRLQNLLENMKGRVRVYCRIRSKLKNEQKYKNPLIYNQKTVSLQGNKTFQFDRIFGSHTKYSQIFDEIKTSIQSIFEGGNMCIFSYGHRCSGNSDTLFGNSLQTGLLPHISKQIFDTIEKYRKYFEVDVKMNLLEIQQQSIKDLITTYNNNKVDIKQDKTGIHLINSVMIKLTNYQELLQAFSEAQNRNIQKQGYDQKLSHTIMILYLTMRNRQTKEHKIIKLSLVQLASPQRQGCTSYANKQMQYINRSLLNLIGAVSTCTSKQFSHQDSKLTFLLKDSLNSQSKIMFFVNISPSQLRLKQTLNTLKFGQRIKNSDKKDPIPNQQQSQINQNIKNQYMAVPRRSSSRLSMG